MSYNISTLIECPNVQVALGTITEKGLNPGASEPAPELQFLTSPLNERGLQQSVVPGQGKLKTVQVVYTPRRLESTVSATVTTGCDDGTSPGQLSTLYELDETVGAEAKETYVIKDLAYICQSNPDYFATQVAALIDVAKRKMQTDVANQMSALFGWFATDGGENVSMLTGNSLKTVKTKYTASIDGGKWNPEALQEIIYSAKNSGFTGTPFIFGSGEIYRYLSLADAAANTSDGGIDFAKFINGNSAAFMQSYKMHNALNGSNSTNYFLTVDAGSLFLLQYNRLKDNISMTGDDALWMGVVVDPVSGIEWNYKVIKTCTEKITVIVSSAYKVVGLPNDIYGATDRLYKTNGVLKFGITNS